MIKFSCMLLLWLLSPLLASDPLRIGLHLSAPWSYYNEQGQPDGIEYQIVSRIFSRAGFEAVYELHSYSRLLKQFTDRKLACASPVAIDIHGASYSTAYLPFQDVAVSLAERSVLLTSLSELAALRIVAYQQAKQVLGKEFQQAVAQASYVEMAERERQLELLFNQRVDVVVGERRVLLHLAAQLAPQHQLQVHPLFEQQLYPAACWQPELTAVFNKGLQQMATTGELEQVLKQYSLAQH